MAQRWAEAGAPLLHTVDLDGAFAGQMYNFGVIQAIVRAIPIPVQLGGGLRDLDAISRAVDAGVQRVVLGTSALEQWDTLVTATARFPGQVCVGIDSRNGQVATRGWQTVSQVETIPFAQRVATTGVTAIIYTDITRDGMLQGPNIAGAAGACADHCLRWCLAIRRSAAIGSARTAWGVWGARRQGLV